MAVATIEKEEEVGILQQQAISKFAKVPFKNQLLILVSAPLMGPARAGRDPEPVPLLEVQREIASIANAFTKSLTGIALEIKVEIATAGRIIGAALRQGVPRWSSISLATGSRPRTE